VLSHLVFVYGTLKEGFPNFEHNHGRRRTGSYLTVQRYPLCLHGDRYSPCLVNRPGEGHQVGGQVFEVDDGALRMMDLLERTDAADGYRREVVDVVESAMLQPRPFRAFVYLKDPTLVHDIRLGPLQEYTAEHAVLYRSRMPT
jgi:gamma-glutamylaminecyclotransferase